jgi:tRNA threonylcarbamoyladenosine biosynthesis protein TsaB
MTMQTILAVETSTQACSACLKRGEDVYLEYELAPQKHADRLLPMVDSVLKQAGIRPGEIDALAYGEGPGAFTGIRIAAGVIQGLAFAWQKPVVSVSTLEALAWQGYQASGQAQWWACLDARMQELYVQSCRIESGVLASDSAQLVSEVQALAMINDSGISQGVGDIDQVFPAIQAAFGHWELALPSAEAVAAIAAQRPEQAFDVEEVLPQPVYLRNDVADKKPTPTA